MLSKEQIMIAYLETETENDSALAGFLISAERLADKIHALQESVKPTVHITPEEPTLTEPEEPTLTEPEAARFPEKQEDVLSREECVSGNAGNTSSENGLSESHGGSDGEKPQSDSSGDSEGIPDRPVSPVCVVEGRGNDGPGHEGDGAVVKLPPGQISIIQALCDLSDVGCEFIRNRDVAEKLNVPLENSSPPLKTLVKKGYVETEGTGRQRIYMPLKRPDGSEYKPPEITIENGIPVTKYAARRAGA